MIRGGSAIGPRGDVLQSIDLLIVDGVIEAVTATGDLPANVGAELNASHCLVMPGLVNGHTHAHGALGKGLVPDRISLEGFLAHAPSILLGRSLDDLRISARLNAVEMLRKGCTACFDMSAELPVASVEGLIAVGSAYAEVGMRAVIAPMIADRTLYEAYPALVDSLPAGTRAGALAMRMPSVATLMAVLESAQREWPYDRNAIQLGVAPTIPLHCSDELLRACGRFSIDHGLPLQTHLAESRLQAIAGRSGETRSLTRRLDSLGCLSSLSSVAHAIWVDDDDIELLASRNVTAIHNPLSNLRLGSGIAPVRRLLDAGVRIGIGTDASNTSDGQNMFEAMRMASYLSRIGSADWSRWISAEEAWFAATAGSARALALPGRFGRVEVGYAADLLLLDLDHVNYVPLRHALRQIVFGESSAGLRTVIIAGEVVFDRGCVLTLDEDRLRTDARAAARRLDETIQADLDQLTQLLPSFASFCCGPTDVVLEAADQLRHS